MVRLIGASSNRDTVGGMGNRARVALAAAVLSGCGVSAVAESPASDGPAIGGAAVASAVAAPVESELSRESAYELGRCVDGIPDDLVDRAHAATDEALFSALIEPCVAAAISLDHDGADEALQQAVGNWLRTLMALDEDYDVHDSQLDASSFARLDTSLAALRAAVRT